MIHTTFCESVTCMHEETALQVVSGLLAVVVMCWRAQLSSARRFCKQEALGFPSVCKLQYDPGERGMCGAFLMLSTGRYLSC